MKSPLSDELMQELAKQAKQQVERFVARFEPSYRYLACHCALPLVLTPELVNYIRIQFLLNEEVPWIAEADLLLSELCRPVGYELYAMTPAVRSNLLAQFKEPEFQLKFGENRLKSLAQLLMDYVTYLMQTHPSAQQAELQAQQWAAMVYLDEHRTKVEEEIATALQALVNRGKNGQAELARLKRLIEEFKPQLSQYDSLIEFARSLGIWLKGQIPPDADQSLTVHGVKLRFPTPEIDFEKSKKKLEEVAVKVALLVGVSEYQPGLKPLPSVIEDVRAMQRVLQHPEMGGFDHVEVLLNPTTQPLRIAIYELFAERSPEDLVLFYFSGHGVKDQNRNLYLTTSETTKSHRGLVVPPTAVAASYLQDQINDSRSDRVVIILDCSYSGMFAKGLTAKDRGEVNINAELGGKSRAILTCSTSVQLSFQQEGGLSIYTQYLVEGMETGAADLDSDGWISVDELHQYATTKVQQASPAMTPQLYSVAEGHRIYLARSPQEVVIPPSLPVFEFDVVTVDAKGQEVKREQGEALYFTEDLGNGVTLEMVYIPSGKFMMGSPEGEGYNSEKPRHEVTVPPFFMGKYPVTQEQWRAIASREDFKVERDLDPNPAYFKDSVRRPVEQVSWYDAVEFCQRLSKQTGKEYRLPSETEWEYACRAGTTTPFYFGETITTDLANYNGNYIYASEPKGEERGETTPVGSFPPNAFGLYDMHGNVWEWCADTWHDNYEGAPTDDSAWTEGGNDNRSPIRGGSWYLGSSVCRSAYRGNFIRVRGGINDVLSFRVVCLDGRINEK